MKDSVEKAEGKNNDLDNLRVIVMDGRTSIKRHGKDSKFT